MSEELNKITEELNKATAERDKLAEQVEELKIRCMELTESANKPVKCNRCGRENAESPVKVKEEILKSYFKSMLGQVPFTHTFYAFDGKLTATFMLHRGDLLDAQYKGRDNMSATAMLVSALMNVKVVDPTTEITTTVYENSMDGMAKAIENVDEAYSKILKALDVIQVAFVRNACDAFMILINQMIEEISSEDFYKGAGLL